MSAVQLIVTALASAAAQQCTYRTIRETFTTDSCEYAAAPTSTTSRAPPVRRSNSTYINTSSIVDGWLVDGRSRSFIGTYTSQLQAYIDDAYAPITKADYENVSLVNSTVLRYLRLRGNYSCDAPLLLPSMFVLKAEGTTIVPASNLTLHNVSRFSALVMLVNVTLSAVVGGTYDASSLPLSPDYPKYTRGYHALSIHGDSSGGKNTIRNVRALANNTGASIGVNEVSHAEVSFSDIGGGAEHGMLNTRCVWTLSVTAALIHDNFIRNCSKHSLDFDAYTSGSAAYSNVIEDHGEEGIFVEETASGNLIFNNTVRRANHGIGVYSNAVGPVANNLIIGNTLEDNFGGGITSGGYGHVVYPNKYSLQNVFASNVLQNNGNGPISAWEIDPKHGAASGDYWTDNRVVGDGVEYREVPSNGSAVVIFEPLA